MEAGDRHSAGPGPAAPPATATPQRRADRRRPQWRTPERLRPHLPLLPLLGIIPSFLVATWSLTQPWARGRFLMLIGISQSPEAVMLVIVAMAGMVAVSVTVAARSRRLQAAAIVHAVTGALMCGVAWVAFQMVKHAGVRLLGLIPIATVRPARGLWLFLTASVLVVVLGAIELTVAVQRARSREARRAAAGIRASAALGRLDAIDPPGGSRAAAANPPPAPPTTGAAPEG